MARRSAPILRAEYESRAGPNIAKDRWHKPELRPLDIEGRPVLVKDYRRRPLLYRETWGRLMVARETVIYRTLDGIPGIPRYYGRMDALAFMIERIDGPEGGQVEPGSLSPAFFDLLRETVLAMHARGVFHGDLRQRRNILVGPEERPYIIDFASGLRLPRNSALLRFLARTDLSGVAKIRRKLAPDTMTDEDLDLLRMERFRPFRRYRVRRREERKRL
jgi:RIO-like serine/threonine protein kinase